MIQTGYYKHYKGTLYKVIGLAQHTETSEQLVLYSSIEVPSKTWARPISIFLGNVEDLEVPRFQFLRS
jgi:hypothetical protein